MARIVGCKNFTVVSISFLPEFSFSDTYNSEGIRGREGTIFTLPYHVHPLRNIQTFIFSFASEMITFLFSIVVHVTIIFLLDSITLYLSVFNPNAAKCGPE